MLKIVVQLNIFEEIKIYIFYLYWIESKKKKELEFFSNTHWIQLFAPLEILRSKISPKYIPNSYSQFWALQGDYEHEIIQPWLPVS